MEEQCCVFIGCDEVTESRKTDRDDLFDLKSSYMYKAKILHIDGSVRLLLHEDVLFALLLGQRLYVRDGIMSFALIDKNLC